MTRTAKLLVAAALILLVSSTIVAALLSWRTVLQARPIAATCGNAVSLYFDGDTSMRTAADRLGRDDRVGSVRMETHEQADLRLRQWLPSNTANDRVEAVAAVHLAVRDPAGRNELAAELETEVPGAKASRAADCSAKAKEQMRDLARSADDLRCGRIVSIFFADEQEMRAAAAVVQKDKRVVKVVVVNRAAAYERARVAFRDKPDLLKDIGPEDVPPSVELTTGPRTDPKALGTELSAKLGGATGAQSTTCVTVLHPVVRPAR